jgi:hypothetical protein
MLSNKAVAGNLCDPVRRVNKMSANLSPRDRPENTPL